MPTPRRALPTDIPRMIALYRDTIHRVNAQHYSPAQLAAWAPDIIDEAAWQTRTASYHVLLTEDDTGMLTGFAELGDDGYIDCFFVSADHQRTGIGRTLMTHLEQIARNRGNTQLHANVSITAKPFFEHHGFTIITPQQVTLRHQTFKNYRMEKTLTR